MTTGESETANAPTARRAKEPSPLIDYRVLRSGEARWHVAPKHGLAPLVVALVCGGM